MADWERILAELVDTRRGALVGYAYVLSGDLHEAEDLVHEAVVRTFSKPRGLTSVGHAEGYVRKAIATIFLNSRRSHRSFLAKVHLLAGDPYQRDTADDLADVDRVRRALDTLSPRQRACVALRYFEHMSVGEVANTLDLAEGSVKRYLADAKDRLTKELGSLEDVDADSELTMGRHTRFIGGTHDKA